MTSRGPWSRASRDPPPGIDLGSRRQVKFCSGNVRVWWTPRLPSRVEDRREDELRDRTAPVWSDYTREVLPLNGRLVVAMSEVLREAVESGESLEDVRVFIARSAVLRQHVEAVSALWRRIESRLLSPTLDYVTDPPADSYVVYRADRDEWIETDDPREVREAVVVVVDEVSEFRATLMKRIEAYRGFFENGFRERFDAKA